MHVHGFCVLVLDNDLQRAAQLSQELQERSHTLTIVTDDIGSALELMKTDHPNVVVVSEEVGSEAAEVLQAIDPDAVVVVVADRVAA